jgi:hypothetical protein
MPEKNVPFSLFVGETDDDRMDQVVEWAHAHQVHNPNDSITLWIDQPKLVINRERSDIPSSLRITWGHWDPEISRKLVEEAGWIRKLDQEIRAELR